MSRMHRNNRHLVEIVMPGGLDRQAEGWRISVRIRMTHVLVRQMLNRSDEWDKAAWGVPLSAFHIAFAASAFCGQLLMHGRQLGLQMTQEEVDSFMHTWRYSGHLMGVPLEMQAATAEDAQRIVRIGRMCEPPPTMEAILVANGLINSAALVAGITDAEKRRKLRNMSIGSHARCSVMRSRTSSIYRSCRPSGCCPTSGCASARIG